MKVKDLKTYLNSLDSKFDEIDIISIEDIRGTEQLENSPKSTWFEINNWMLVDEQVRIDKDDFKVTGKPYLILTK